MFKLWMNTRNKEKQKLNSYKLFLDLYNLFPETCIELVSSHLLIDIGYWKDIYLIWELINNLNMTIENKYNKYNKLIEAFCQTILNQRTEDLRKLNKCVSPKKLGDFSNDDLREFLKINNPMFSLSYVGKYCIREKSVFNKCLFWYVKTDTELIKQSNISYMMRGSLRIINDKNELCEFPFDKQVPSATKKTYRKLNAKLNVALDVPEMLMCNKQFELLDPLTFPYLFRTRNEKTLLKNNILKIERKDSDYNYSFNESFNDSMNKPIYNSLEKSNIINKIFKDIDILLI